MWRLEDIPDSGCDASVSCWKCRVTWPLTPEAAVKRMVAQGYGTTLAETIPLMNCKKCGTPLQFRVESSLTRVLRQNSLTVNYKEGKRAQFLALERLMLKRQG